MPTQNNESDETRLTPRDEYWQVRYKLRTIEDWRKEVNADRTRLEERFKEYEKRIRDLEDYKLSAVITHRNLAKWITIAASCFSAAIAIIEHLFFK